MGRSRFAIVAAVSAALALPASALGGTVEVQEVAGEPNRATLTFAATPAEANRLTVSLAGETDTFYELELLDEGAAVAPGSGCSGGGSAGVPVLCKVHKPHPGANYTCFKGCYYTPGTRWETHFAFRLGDAGSRLDASGLPEGARYPELFWPTRSVITVTVSPGAGPDVVLTGPEPDLIEASDGDDLVRTGSGVDRFHAGPLPDGADDVQFGEPTYASVDFSARQAGVSFDPNGIADDGAPGEGDNYGPASKLTGGSGGDTLVAGNGPEPRYGVITVGGAGDDTIRGGSANDEIYGGAGDDAMFGEGGIDRIAEPDARRSEEDSGNDFGAGGADDDRIELGAGEDEAVGDAGGDRIELGPDADRAAAGAGDDLVLGGAGDDEIRGDAGEDRLSGDVGRDTMLGGAGSDWITAGTSVVQDYRRGLAFLDAPGPLEGMPDRVDCGSGRDGVKLGRGDAARGCEVRRRASLLELLAIVQPEYATTETAVRLAVRQAGVIRLSGEQIRPRRTRWENAGIGGFVIEPVGTAAAEKKRSGHVRVEVKIAFHADDGRAVVRELSLTLWNAAALSRRHHT
jgi:RTX calcium-binding nonapeptide repeat (4 copies)